MATVTVDQAKLVLNSFAAIFQNNLVSKDLVTWKKFDGEMNDRNGLTVVEQVVPDYTTTFTTSVVSDLTAGVQDTTFGSEQYKLSQVIGSSMGWADFVKIRDIGEARESEALKMAALRLAIDIDSYIMGYVAKASNSWTGNANGTNSVSAFADIAKGVTRMKKQGVEDEVVAVLDYTDWEALSTAIVNNNASLPDIGSSAYRGGYTGNIAGINTIFTQQLGTITTGSRATASALTAGTADSTTAYASVAVSTGPGKFKTQLLNMNIVGATATIKDGEIFTIAGVFAYDNRAKKALDYLQQFRVIGDFTAAASVVAPRVYPALITSGPYQTIAQAPANTAVVTFLGAASTVLSPRFMANKNAVMVSCADLIMPATGTAMRKSLTKVPVSVRMWRDSVFATGEHRIRFDVALECNTRANGREKVIRINGA
jgi:hypothetical protein